MNCPLLTIKAHYQAETSETKRQITRKTAPYVFTSRIPAVTFSDSEERPDRTSITERSCCTPEFQTWIIEAVQSCEGFSRKEEVLACHLQWEVETLEATHAQTSTSVHLLHGLFVHTPQTSKLECPCQVATNIEMGEGKLEPQFARSLDSGNAKPRFYWGSQQVLLRSKFATEFLSTANGTRFGFAYLPNFAIELYQPQHGCWLTDTFPPLKKNNLHSPSSTLLSPLYSPSFSSPLCFFRKALQHVRNGGPLVTLVTHTLDRVPPFTQCS